MHLYGYCPGCGGEGNQSCKIAGYSLQNGKPEYCSRCKSFPCEKYVPEEAYDSFITHRNQLADFQKLEQIGAEACQTEQRNKVELLKEMLDYYNDGRKKPSL